MAYGQSCRCCNGVRLTCGSGFSHDKGVKMISMILFLAITGSVLIILHIEQSNFKHVQYVQENIANGNASPSSDTEPTDLTDESLSYGIVFDCGSSGTRVYIYCWPPHSGSSNELLKVRQVIGTDGKPLSKKVSPGLSTYNNNSSFSAEYLKPLLEFAAQVVPEHKHKESPLYILATAGMRLIDEVEAKQIHDDIVTDIPDWFEFYFDESHVQVITGEEEGMYAWISLNYMLGRLSSTSDPNEPTTPIDEYDISSSVSGIQKKHHGTHMNTVGVVDMGGGSLQIAFEVENAHDVKDNKHGVSFNLGFDDNDDTFSYHVYTSTFLGYGANSALERYRQGLVSSYKNLDNTTVIEDPCQARDSKAIHLYQTKEVKLVGTGNIQQCMDSLKPLLNADEICSMDPCSIDGVHQPSIPAKSTFYGISEYWYSTYDVLNLKGYYNPASVSEAAQEYCNTPWDTTMRRYKQQFYPHADMARMTNQCFKVSWIMEVLHHGLRFPREYTNFLPVSEINGQEVQWSLGALIHRTRYLPLKYRTIRHSGQPYSVHMVPYVLVICIVIVVLAILLYCRHLHKMKALPSLKNVPSMSYFMIDADQAESGVLKENHCYS